MGHSAVARDVRARDSYLDVFARRHAMIIPILEKIEREGDLATKLQDILTEALKGLPHVPKLGREEAVVLIRHEEIEPAIIRTELAWLGERVPRLLNDWEAIVHRHLGGLGSSHTDRDTARYYLALVVRLWRLEYAIAA
jgi:hypothetical protein